MAADTPPEDPHILQALADKRRVDALRMTGLLDEPPSESFERLVELATKILDVPTAVVSLLEPAHQFFLASYGVGEPWAEQRGTPLSLSFCKHVVADNDELVVTDSRTDSKVKDNLAIDELDVIAYAGTPLRLFVGRGARVVLRGRYRAARVDADAARRAANAREGDDGRDRAACRVSRVA